MTNVNRIAFLCHPYHRGGVTRWMADAAIYCTSLGMEVYFLTVSPKKEFHSAPGRATMLGLLSGNEDKVHIITQSVGFEFEFGTPAYRASIYGKLLQRLKPGIPIILSDDFAVWEAATRLCRSFQVVGVLHADEETYYSLAVKYHSKVALLVGVSERVVTNTRKRIPALDSDHIVTIPCGINLPPAPIERPDNTAVRIVFVGRISQFQKRASDLVNIAKALREKGFAFSMAIIGDGPQKAELQRIVEGSGLGCAVSFPGWLSQAQVYDQLAASDILLLTSDFEGTPIAMMEAFASGCGVVATRVSGIEDYENHRDAEYAMGAFPVGDIDSAVTALKRIASVPLDTRRLSARRLAESEFAMSVCINRYLAAISKHDFPNAPVVLQRMGYAQFLKSYGAAVLRQVRVSLLKR